MADIVTIRELIFKGNNAKRIVMKMNTENLDSRDYFERRREYSTIFYPTGNTTTGRFFLPWTCFTTAPTWP
ncbi:hypothetical protein BJX99DRAFT_234272 [Aspergillus californicus]